MTPELDQRLGALEQKVEATLRAAQQTRTYLLWTFVITAAAILLPLVGLLFAIPTVLSTYSGLMSL